MEAFPAGLRVLVVDDDPTWLKILEKMLKKCSYEVTTCGLARDALKLLRERKDGYDIVISDVNMPDMDGFKLLEHVGLKMDLPVIMMSVDGETSRVMKGVQHGACDYLLKPIRMKELRNIWQHVFRKRMHEVRDIERQEGIEDLQMLRNGTELFDGDCLFSGDHIGKKRKDAENKHDDKDLGGDPSSTKKPRVAWSVDLHQKFVKAVNQIGFDKVGPKKILDLMNVPWLTRENVASHLQKYRLYLSRLQRENELKATSGGSNNLDHSPKDSSGSFGLKNSSNTQQSDGDSTNLRSSGKTQTAQTDDAESNEIDVKSIHLLSFEDPTPPFNVVDISAAHTASSSPTALNSSFGLLEPGLNLASLDYPIASQYPWHREVPGIQFDYGHNLHHELEACFIDTAFHAWQQITQADLLHPAPCINPSDSIREPSNAKHSNRDIRESFPLIPRAAL
ncbi:hypothetical protein Nepgr_027928 [Nepenthes gracilis]|uniref:Response regulatory domain-containing protein n=1 Tax=Nepenthes gracilis TaxID=150966 RepID=A0AAD3Y3F5_NEPGR|nr:hypothetical protein Nepgr_027928 [Nepenthes gracilis]